LQALSAAFKRGAPTLGPAILGPKLLPQLVSDLQFLIVRSQPFLQGENQKLCFLYCLKGKIMSSNAIQILGEIVEQQRQQTMPEGQVQSLL